MKEEWPRTDFARALVDLDAFQAGGPPKDGIPAIGDPAVEDIAEGSRWLDPREPVIALSMGDDARACPLQFLLWHEIANDSIDGRPVAVTFCPLCNAAIIFDRRVSGRVLDFGTTGKLRKSDLVMYDRQTGNWWQQFTGEAVVGELAGTRLKRIAAPIVACEDLRREHPAGQVPGG